MQVLAEGVKAAGSLASSDVSDALRGNQITTLLDGLRFTEGGDLENPEIWIYQVQNGEFVQVE